MRLVFGEYTGKTVEQNYIERGVAKGKDEKLTVPIQMDTGGLYRLPQKTHGSGDLLPGNTLATGNTQPFEGINDYKTANNSATF